MKRTAFALATVLVVFAAGYLAWSFWQGSRTAEPGAPTGVVATVSTPDASAAGQPTITGSEPPSNEATTVPTPAIEAEETVVEARPVDEPDAVPALPLLSAAGLGTGMGGGGGDGNGVTQPVDFWNPWSDTVYTLSSTLPAEPIAAIVYEHPASGIFTQEDVARFTESFGVSGPIYIDAYPQPAAGEEAFQPQTLYHVFDGAREIHVSDTFMSYFDQQASNLPFKQLPESDVIALAEQFLLERGLLDFDYQPRYFYGNTVEFRRVVDGRIAIFPEFQVGLAGDGRIAYVSYNPLSQLAAVGNYPLRSADAAWQALLAGGIDNQRVTAVTSPGPGYPAPETIETTPIQAQVLAWQRTYTDGETITLYPYPSGYVPLDSSVAPRLFVDRFLLTGPAEALWEIANYVGKPLRLTGSVRGSAGDGPMGTQQLELVEWAPAADAQLNEFLPGLPGTVSRSGETVLFTSDAGETLVIAGAPADLPDGLRVYLYGYRSEETDANGRTIFQWQNIEQVLEEVESPAETLPTPTPYKVGEVNINSAELAYVYTPIWSEDSSMRIFLQPAWRFRGTTDTNEFIEIYIQAVEDAYLQPAP